MGSEMCIRDRPPHCPNPLPPGLPVPGAKRSPPRPVAPTPYSARVPTSWTVAMVILIACLLASMVIAVVKL